jgi:succinate dehydrogenase flavin-adding protein (antitoxin of CptAB toxin-antitoxin module)
MVLHVMKNNLFPLFLIFTIFVCSESAFSQFDYTDLDNILKKYVRGKSVSYADLAEDKENLYRFTNLLSETSPRSNPDLFKSKNEQLAYWINAYNAYILKIIVENYPVESIKDINFIGFTVWLNKNTLGGEDISFKSLEDDIIRDEFKDPRIHFAINCASFSCPPLINEAYLPEILDKQLDESTRSFINDQDNFRIDIENGLIYMSSIFDWYDNDFFDWLTEHKKIEDPVLLDYIKLHYDNQIKEEWYSYDIEFIEYDWKLNDVQ